MTYNIHFSVAVGLDEPGVKNNISVFPNPANDRIYVKVSKKPISVSST